MYVVKPGDWNGGNAILVLHDVFGPDSGRTKQICDEWAAKGYLVAMPVLWKDNLPESYDEGPMILKLFKLIPMISWLRKNRWKRIGPLLTDHAIPWMVEQGATVIALACFCFGFYPMVYLLAENKQGVLAGGVGLHPSLQVFSAMHESSKPLLDKIDKPLMMLSSGGDPGDIKPGGRCDKAFRPKACYEKCVFKLYPDMIHGWVNRGDLGNEKIKRDYDDSRMVSGAFLESLFL
mmetsp:Transcript_4607/g.12943  ORF Transcript_4607/g.12943 Transcript_4607/m.12943 type:complete len:234 (+) Transcript_4607:321-1022(+)